MPCCLIESAKSISVKLYWLHANKWYFTANKDEERRKTTTALLKKTEGVFQRHGHYITQNFDLSSLTGRFLKNIFILFSLKKRSHIIIPAVNLKNVRFLKSFR